MSIYAELGRYVQAYRHGVDTLESAGVPLRSPTYDRRSTGKPESRTPSASDPELRWRLILSVQSLANAIRHLVPLFENFTAWEPTRLAQTTVVRMFGKPVLRLLDCDERGQVVWKDPADVQTPVLSPSDVAVGVDQLQGLLGAVNDDTDAETVADALAEAHRAVATLKGAGVWSRPKQTATPPTCAVETCATVPEWGNQSFRRLCSKHRKSNAA